MTNLFFRPEELLGLRVGGFVAASFPVLDETIVCIPLRPICQSGEECGSVRQDVTV